MFKPLQSTHGAAVFLRLFRFMREFSQNITIRGGEGGLWISSLVSSLSGQDNANTTGVSIGEQVIRDSGSGNICIKLEQGIQNWSFYKDEVQLETVTVEAHDILDPFPRPVLIPYQMLYDWARAVIGLDLDHLQIVGELTCALVLQANDLLVLDKGHGIRSERTGTHLRDLFSVSEEKGQLVFSQPVTSAGWPSIGKGSPETSRVLDIVAYIEESEEPCSHASFRHAKDRSDRGERFRLRLIDHFPCHLRTRRHLQRLVRVDCLGHCVSSSNPLPRDQATYIPRNRSTDSN